MSRAGYGAHGESHAGNVRKANEDCFLIDDALGLYLVLDGMGGHSAGDVASALARDRIREHVAARRGAAAPRRVLEEALHAASAAVFERARQERALTGMGTTVVACLALGGDRVVIAHVGDSRAYLVRDGRLSLLTGDHTVVAELVARGGLDPDQAERHPYKSVLSRNLGGKEGADVDLRELALEPGDRLLLCSDGLNGYASHQAIEQAIAAAGDPIRASRDLIELALRGGGGDNVTAVVIERPRVAEQASTVSLRRDAAAAWAGRRARFLAAAEAMGAARSPLCAVLSADEAIAIVAGNLFDALAHDLEQTTGVHAWTYAEDLAAGWLDQGGALAEVRWLLDVLGRAIDAVIAEVEADDPPLAPILEAAVVRGLVVVEMALAAVLGERLRRVEDELATIQGDDTLLPTIAEDRRGAVARAGDGGRGGPAAPSPELERCLAGARRGAEQRLARDAAAPEASACLAVAHRLAVAGAEPGALLGAARALSSGRPLTEAGILPLVDALDHARRVHLRALHREVASDEVKAIAVARLVAVHPGLALALAGIVSDAAGEVGAELGRALARTAELRAQLERGEAELSRLARALRESKTRDGFAPTGADG